ncbi:hypothetical protein RND81_06G247900 [Saponaria officinalis]|uniref:NAB domain-containing protein n=2 Tax=Saponaria officinalis TaxID=3572 RepID=A0AAW1KF38_SAPOF
MLPLSIVGVPLEMTKQRWKELMQALFESHFNPTNDEQLKQSKLEIEKKVPRILKLIKDRRQSRRNKNTEAIARKESELIELIEDFHTQYQFVYDLYDNLRDQLSKTVNDSTEDEGYYTATSSSDSDIELDDEDVDEVRLHTQHLEKQVITNITEEKDKIEAMYRKRETDKIVQVLEEKARALQEQLRKKENDISRFSRLHKVRLKETSGLIEELESELSSSNVQLSALCKEKWSVDVQVENDGVRPRVSSLEVVAKEVDEEFNTLVSEDDVAEDGFVSEVSRLKKLVVQVNRLKQNVDCLNAQKAYSEGLGSHENLLDQVNKMKNDLGTMRKKNAELERNVKKKSQENSDLLSHIDSLKREITITTQSTQKEKEDAQVRAKSLESEMHNQSSQKSEVERKLARKNEENVELKQELERLQQKMVNLETMLKEREDQFCSLQKKFNNGEDDDKPAQMVSLISQINHLEHDLGSKNEFERQLKIKNQEIIKLTSERELLQGRVSELDNKLQDRGHEFSKLQNDMSTQIVALTKQVNQLQEETYMKRKLEDQISYNEREISQLVDEKESLQAKILELEITLTEKEDEIASLKRRVQLLENETSAKVSGLASQISYLQGALSAERKKSLEKLTQMENQNSELTCKLSDQQVILKQQEDNINKLREDSKLVKGRFLQAADRKMDEVADEFRKNFEGKLRILSQRIRVAESLHGEDKDHLKKLKTRCEREHPGIQKKLADLMSSNKGELVKFSQAVDELMTGMEHVINDFESREGSFMQRLSRLSGELEVAKNWVRWTMDEIKPWKNNELPGSPTAQVDEKEQEKIMKEKIRRLEAKVNKEKGDKLRLMRGMYDHQRKISELERTVEEKEDGLKRVEMEKVEAIKQLCIWIEYHQSKFDHLREVMLMKKSNIRGRC